MNRGFSIGEVSKLHNVSIQTLRHYDKIGLLKPAYINEKSKYRYYSVDNFIMLDFIKQCKVMGLALEDIKDLINNYTSVNSILDIITKQKEIIAERIKELENVKENVNMLEYKIQAALNDGIGEPFVMRCEKRSFIKYNNIKRYTDEFEIELTYKSREIEKKYGTIYKESAFAIPYEKVNTNSELNYEHMMLCLYDNILDDTEESAILPAGNYVTIHFYDDFKDIRPYYNKIIKYINKNNLSVGDTFYECYILTCIGKDDDVKSLGQVQIQLL